MTTIASPILGAAIPRLVPAPEASHSQRAIPCLTRRELLGAAIPRRRPASEAGHPQRAIPCLTRREIR